MSNIKLFGSDKVKDLVTDTLYGCDDGELYIENNISESFLFDDGVLKNTSFNEFVDDSKKERYGPFESYEDAKKYWDKISWENVDNCNVRYIILPHR